MSMRTSMKKNNEKMTMVEKQAVRFHSKAEANKKWSEHLADHLTAFFGTVWFLTFNACFFVFWILANSGMIPGINVFDPHPFIFLTTAVSLEAIILSIIVLITEKRASKLEQMREELDLQINIQAENEITKILNMLDEIHDHLGLKSNENDEELKIMKERTDVEKIEEDLANRKELTR